MQLMESETLINLMRAFAGESQARNRYTFAAGLAKKQKLQAVQQVFLYTADQEKEHGEIFYNYLKKSGLANISLTADYPVDRKDDILTVLQNAQNNEFSEYEDVYPSFANIAHKEGFAEIARSFELIAGIEKVHGERFRLFADYLNRGQLFISDVTTGWICLNCGYVFMGTETPQSCPVCAHDRGYFIRLELSPYYAGVKQTGCA